MADTAVSEDLCQARRDETDRRLENIEQNVLEARQGVGKILRYITEGNGQPPLLQRMATCEHAITGIGDAVKERKRTSLALWIAVIGWIVTITLTVVKII